MKESKIFWILFYRYDEPFSHIVMLNLFQHLVELWSGTISFKDPELNSGRRWAWQSALSFKVPLTFRPAEHRPLPSC